MTTRELRNQRREDERKAKKIAYKQDRLAAAALAANPELLDEFSAEEQSEMMALRARVHARSGHGPTGPTSPEGKIISSGNSLKHGLASGRLIIPGEDPAQFDALLRDLLAEHQPASPTESVLVRQMAESYWLMQRALRLQNEAFTETGVDAQKLALFLRYQTTHERAFYKALNLLLKLAAREFVSQKRQAPRKAPEFVSQNGGGAAFQAAMTAFQPAFPGPKPPELCTL